jgi:DNA-binding transcriptional MerR regulator
VILIGELAKRTQCSVRVIRHYEQCGLLLSIRSGNGYRRFDEAAVEHVMRIRVLLRNGFNLDEIRPVATMLDARSKKLICADVIRLYESKVDQIEQRIAELTEVRDRAKRRLHDIVEQRNQGGPVETDVPTQAQGAMQGMQNRGGNAFEQG